MFTVPHCAHLYYNSIPGSLAMHKWLQYMCFISLVSVYSIPLCQISNPAAVSALCCCFFLDPVHATLQPSPLVPSSSSHMLLSLTPKSPPPLRASLISIGWELPLSIPPWIIKLTWVSLLESVSQECCLHEISLLKELRRFCLFAQAQRLFLYPWAESITIHVKYISKWLWTIA